MNISYPHDESAVNRNIVRCTRLWNVSFDQAAAIAASLGRGTLMWKFDLVSAYKLVASLVQDWHLQGELEIIDSEVLQLLHHHVLRRPLLGRRLPRPR